MTVGRILEPWQWGYWTTPLWTSFAAGKINYLDLGVFYVSWVSR